LRKRGLKHQNLYDNGYLTLD